MIQALVVFAAVSGCGVESIGPGEPLPVAPPPISIVGGAGADRDFPDFPGITRTADAVGNARYLGEVQNQGDRIACNIRVSINSYERIDPAVNPGDPNAPENFRLMTNPANQRFGFADLLGESMRYSLFAPATIETCLSPGNRATFDVPNDFALSRVDKIEASTTCDGTLYEGCLPLPDSPDFVAPSAAVVLSGTITEGTTTDGRVRYTGTLRNQSPAGGPTAYHTKIVFTAKNAAWQVVDAACATIDGAVCPPPSGAQTAPLGMAPGDQWHFTVDMSVPPTTTCSGCFSYLINHKPAP
ncbi:MAG: hypothetical protein ACOYXR_13050 [Nitrospirota bacterium]